jgi:hypothetical protein
MSMPVINWQKLNNERMKKKILTGLGTIIFCTALILNVSLAKDNNSLELNKMNTIAVAQDEGIGEGSGGGGSSTDCTTTTTILYWYYTNPPDNSCVATEYRDKCNPGKTSTCNEGPYTLLQCGNGLPGYICNDIKVIKCWEKTSW